MKLTEVLDHQLKFANNSGLEVDVDERLGTVAMTVDGRDLCFLQGEAAEEFIDKANGLYNDEELDLYFDDACKLAGYPYLDLDH